MEYPNKAKKVVGVLTFQVLRTTMWVTWRYLYFFFLVGIDSVA